MTKASHPAPYSPVVLGAFQTILDTEFGCCAKVLDPFGGVGGIHDLEGHDTYAVEIEPEWANESRKKGKTLCLDSRKLNDFLGRITQAKFDAIATSPTYANRMADHHNAKDGSKRRTYKHLLGRDLTPGNSGGMQWGEEYRQLHKDVYAAVTPLVHEGGLFILNIKDHVRKGERVPVTDFHVDTLRAFGWKFENFNAFESRGYRFGANRTLRFPERIYTFSK